jgi:hypothetical protein
MNTTGMQPLTSRQILVMALMGAVLWLAAALLIRALEPSNIFEGGTRVLVYALTLPGTWPFVLLLERFGRLARNQVAMGYAVGTASATLLDGLALAWLPSLYGSSVAHIAGAGAVILWGAGVGLVLAFIRNRA